ncbi:MAG: hypothetical protein KGD57_04175, partial [Candidatus Lokiarchaeota archaeon]|nr:hypothetical protein [Candidatus Lokiarchaeota archaeon]
TTVPSGKTISNPIPEDDAIDVFAYPSLTLSVDIYDPNKEFTRVVFYDASDDTKIGMATIIISPVVFKTHSVEWSGLSSERTYQWYVIVYAEDYQIKSEIMTFTTANVY